ncbi:MAG: cyclic nucleotide-binding domain-containing protein [Dehalococcoidia bacterium]|nr:cyclic nucleotide-binding domain-containing protein [Dehalococcoidia bacterium]
MPVSEERVYAPGEVIVGSGQPADKVYIVVEGSARAVYHVGSPPTPRWAVVDIVGAGRLFGMVPALDGEPHVAQLEAMTGTRVLIVDRQAFLHELADHPEVATNLMRQLASYIRNTERWLVTTL